ncbi:polysaccharide biosynthesis protein [Psychrobacter sp. FDAARGOS_221]|uniref:polysaccharide biosynthesis protein n=1 Tax=Psychrobacter sp. FDAARGOS_221 TaxID=1975705 RepID=UPI000BB5473E|nr:nucleoside-diphosphate sugar epimerase/dehydratase [Psychrobacter sp. FDAARGOS_221]PNK60500.1 polysaccharide biosynthesis protein [Psychrobacter sp. FDAARGOS_221]
MIEPDKTSHTSRKDLTHKTANKVASLLLGLPRPAKQAILFIGDYIVSILCLFLALSLRQGMLDVNASPVLVAFYALIPVAGLYAIGFYRGVTRIFFDTDMRRVLLLFVVIIMLYALVFILDGITSIPRSVPLLYLFMLFIWLWGSRLFLRDLLLRLQGKPIYQNSQYHSSPNQVSDKVIIYGAGISGTALLDALQDSPRYEVVAFVDDDTRLTGGHILGKKIYKANNIEALVDELDVVQVFLAMPSVSRQRRREIINDLTNLSVKIKELPSLQDIAEGKVTVSTMRRVDILDVLDRQTVEPNEQLLRQNITGKNVLVTGAGGSIGSELCRQIIKHQPKCLVLYELSEYALYAIHQELLSWQKQHPESQSVEIFALLGNVTNADRLYKIFNKHNIQTVYHAAAYKHVPIVEFNPFEGAVNNAKGTYHCVKAATDSGVETFVLISTDKAVRPTNIMGASKRLAELVCQGFSNELAAKQNSQSSVQSIRISMVRFGNVLGSSGSVVPLFTKQIAQGGPITVTHPEVTRYFMTIPEAANLVIQAGAMAQGGEVFVLDMGNPVKIVDLARRMIHLSGYQIKDEQHPEGDIEIVFSGLRPGEKLYEELIIGDDNIESTQHPLIMQAREHSFSLTEIETTLEELNIRSQQHDVAWLKQQFKKYVEGYQPN